MILIFIGIQVYRKDKATLPLSVLKQRTVASACLFLFFEGAAIMILIYYSTLPHGLTYVSSHLLSSNQRINTDRLRPPTPPINALPRNHELHRRRPSNLVGILYPLHHLRVSSLHSRLWTHDDLHSRSSCLASLWTHHRRWRRLWIRIAERLYVCTSRLASKYPSNRKRRSHVLTNIEWRRVPRCLSECPIKWPCDTNRATNP